MSSSTDPSIFRYGKLKEFLRHVSDNYEVTTIQDWLGQNAVILRHDVDFDVERAYRVCLLEEECGLKSTFFFLTSSPIYNILSLRNRNLVADMAKRGFEIGLHFDPAVYPDHSEERLLQDVHIETRLMETICDQEIKSVSLHNPSIQGTYPLFAGYHNAYDPAIFAPDRYISDSRMIFRHDLYEFIKRVVDRPVQVLLHPEHYSENGDSYPDIFDDFVIGWVNQVDETFNVNSTYAASKDVDLMTYILRKRSKKTVKHSNHE